MIDRGCYTHCTMVKKIKLETWQRNAVLTLTTTPCACHVACIKVYTALWLQKRCDKQHKSAFHFCVCSEEALWCHQRQKSLALTGTTLTIIVANSLDYQTSPPCLCCTTSYHSSRQPGLSSVTAMSVLPECMCLMWSAYFLKLRELYHQQHATSWHHSTPSATLFE